MFQTTGGRPDDRTPRGIRPAISTPSWEGAGTHHHVRRDVGAVESEQLFSINSTPPSLGRDKVALPTICQIPKTCLKQKWRFRLAYLLQ